MLAAHCGAIRRAVATRHTLNERVGVGDRLPCSEPASLPALLCCTSCMTTTAAHFVLQLPFIFCILSLLHRTVRVVVWIVYSNTRGGRSVAADAAMEKLLTRIGLLSSTRSGSSGDWSSGSLTSSSSANAAAAAAAAAA
ncbi:hypothetical protein DQ04_25241000, partial [Trypanosoma grayi]|uniref:hypothetical protein n=1 Tax=Trypanosoma grayi TaxID=71804 RepID=UPI0004F4A6CA